MLKRASWLLVCLALPVDGSERLALFALQPGDEVGFAERQMSPLLKSAVERSGVLSCDEDGTLRMEVLEPRRERRSVTDTHVSLERPKGSTWKTRRAALDPDKAAHLPLIAIRDLAHGRVAALEARFEISETADGATWRIDLTPKSPSLRKRLSTLTLHGEGDQLQRVYTRSGARRWTEITFQP